MENNTVIETIYTGPDVVFSLQQNNKNGAMYFSRYLPASYQNDSLRLQQFEQESRLLESLSNIKGLLRGKRSKIAGSASPFHYDYEDYHTLAQIVNDCVSYGQRIPLPLAIAWSMTIIDTIESLKTAIAPTVASEIDIAIWPDSLLVNSSGNIYISHFSLNYPLSISSSIIKQDLKRYFIYTAPEQTISGHPPEGSALYFVLGMLLYEILTSKPLFMTHTQSNLKQIIRRKLRKLHPLLSDADKCLESFNAPVSELLAPDPNNRLINLEEVKDKLLEFSCQLKISDKPDIKTLYHELRELLSEKMNKAPEPGGFFETTNINQFNAS